MEISKYFQNLKEINNIVLLYLDEFNDDQNYQKLISAFDSMNYCKNHEELQILLFPS